VPALGFKTFLKGAGGVDLGKESQKVTSNVLTDRRKEKASDHYVTNSARQDERRQYKRGGRPSVLNQEKKKKEV